MIRIVSSVDGLYPAPSVTPTITELEEMGVHQLVMPADQSNYTVNALDSYYFPLVYGSGIVNGAENPSAYTSYAGNTGELVLQHFLNAKGYESQQ